MCSKIWRGILKNFIKFWELNKLCLVHLHQMSLDKYTLCLFACTRRGSYVPFIHSQLLFHEVWYSDAAGESGRNECEFCFLWGAAFVALRTMWGRPMVLSSESNTISARAKPPFSAEPGKQTRPLVAGHVRTGCWRLPAASQAEAYIFFIVYYMFVSMDSVAAIASPVCRVVY
jgi:hypothetical protein